MIVTYDHTIIYGKSYMTNHIR